MPFRLQGCPRQRKGSVIPLACVQKDEDGQKSRIAEQYFFRLQGLKIHPDKELVTVLQFVPESEHIAGVSVQFARIGQQVETLPLKTIECPILMILFVGGNFDKIHTIKCMRGFSKIGTYKKEGILDFKQTKYVELGFR